jgi:hypothetical protein
MSTSAQESEKDASTSDSAAGGDNGAAESAPAVSGEWNAGALSEDEADRLSERFRPSWAGFDDDEAFSAPAPEPAPVAAAPAPVSAPAAPPVAPPAPIVMPPVASSQPAAAPSSAITAPMSPVAPSRAIVTDAYAAIDPLTLPKQSMSRGMMLGIGIGAVALVAVIIGLVTSGDSDAEEIASAGSAPSVEQAAPTEPRATEEAVAPAPTPTPTTTAAAPAEPEPAAAIPAPPPAPPRVHVQIRTEPASATLSIDGRRVDNPYTTELEAAAGDHTLLASAVGHEPRRETVRFDTDVDLTLTLTPSAPPAAPARTVRAARRASRMRAAMAAAARMTTTPAMRGSFVTTNPY